LRPKLMEAADIERAAMVARLRTTAALERMGCRLRGSEKKRRLGAGNTSPVFENAFR